MNETIKQINNKGWFMLFQWQMPDGQLYVIFRRTKVPEFVVSSHGVEESRIYGDIQVKVALIESFIKENDIQGKMDDFIKKTNERFEYVDNKLK